MTEAQFFKRYTYNIATDKLGGGAFGTVYKAYDNVLDKFVAIKIAEVKEVGGKVFSLLDEFDALKDLPAHKNIANYEQVYTFQQSNGVYDYAIIQYYPHGNLKALQENTNLSLTEKEDIAKQLLEGIAFLHDNNVVHRDLKPSNILVHRRGNGQYIPKIADFGLSKKSTSSQMTNSFAGGTVEFSSPEQLKGKRIQMNTDLWSFGVIIYGLFTGKSLFNTNTSNGSAEQNQQLFDKIFNSDLSEKLQDPRIPEQWRAILKRCLVKDNLQRVSNARELLGMLNGEQQTQGYRDETIIQTRVTAKQDTSERPTISQAKTSTKEKHQPKKKNKLLVPIILGVLAIAIIGFAYNYFSNQNNGQLVSNDDPPKIDSVLVSDELPFEPNELLRRKYGNKYRLATAQDYYWNDDEKKLIEQMRETQPMYPFVARGDFNNDHEEDYAFLVKQISNNENKIFIYSPKYDYDFIPNTATVQNFNALSKESKSKILNPRTGEFINLKSDAILLDNFNGNSNLMYWDGTTYRIENMGF